MDRGRGAALSASVLAGLALASPAAGLPASGSIATVDVAVATLWTQPGIARTIDAPALRDPVDPAAWNRNLATTASRTWLVGRVVTQALYGERVRVVGRRGDWARVVVADQPTPLDSRGYPGWLPVRQLHLAPTFDPRGPYVVIKARTAKLHLRGRTVTLGYGTRLPLVRCSGPLAIVRTPDGRGTVAAARPGSPSGASIVAAARRFVGLRYLWGGTSAWGFDCSGLVWTLFRAEGITVPRDADPQFRHGAAVATTNLRAGDLLSSARRATPTTSRSTPVPGR